MYLLPQPKQTVLREGALLFDREKPIVTKKINKTLASNGGYRLTVKKDGVLIEGADESGLYYGELTLKQLLMNYRGYLPYLEITDEPTYAYRGFMIDPCRHFFTVDEIKKMIDGAALFKFNYFHFHLWEDQGVRFESEKYPLLHKKGAYRNGSAFSKSDMTTERYGGYYTKEELREIVAYCKERFIEVIPEIDMPGHTTAVLSAYPELSCREKPIEAKLRGGIFDDILCVGNENVLIFAEDIIDELCEIFPCRYFNIGGDEAPKVRWKECPKCQQKKNELGLKNEDELQGWFINELAHYLKKKGKHAICWNDALKGNNLDKDNLTVALWMNKNGETSAWANEGGKVIMENFDPYYADYPYGLHTLKKNYTFDPKGMKGFNSIGKENIIGVETPIWTEYVTDFKRMSYLCFPRWLAVAETGWNGNGNKDYNRFLADTAFFCDVLKEMGHSPAPKEEWKLSPRKRLAEITEFFGNAATKENIKNLLGNKTENES